MSRAAPVAAAVVLFASPLHAQCPSPPPDVSPLQPGEIGLFFDTAGTQTCKGVPFFQPLDVYVVTRVPAGGIVRFGVGSLLVEGSALVDLEGLTRADGFQHAAIVDGCDEGEAEPGTCPAGAGEVVALASFTVMRTAGEPTICIGALCNDTIAGPSPPGSYPPFYVACTPGSPQVAFTLGDLLCLRLGDGSVAVQEASWSLLKRRFAN